MNESFPHNYDPKDKTLHTIKAVEKNQEVCIIINSLEFVGSERRK
jgi:hypothetical protein